MHNNGRIKIIASIIVFVIISCSQNNDLAVRFKMEKMVYNVSQLRKELTIKTEKLTGEELYTVVSEYQKIVNYIPAPVDSIEYNRASDDKKEALAIASLARIEIGLLYLEAGAYKKSYTYFYNVAHNPGTNGVQLNGIIGYLALLKSRMRQYNESAELYNEYAEGYLTILDPNKPDINAIDARLKAADMSKKLGNIEIYHEQLKDSRKYYQTIMESNPDTPIYNMAFGKIIASYIKEDDFRNAVDLIESTRNSNSRAIEPEFLLMMAGLFSNDIKDFNKSSSLYQEFIDTYPDHSQLAVACLGLGLSLYECGKYVKARETVDDIEKITDVKYSQVADAYYLKALCYEKEGKWPKALNQFNLLSATLPGSVKSFEAKLYIANRYANKNEVALSKRSFKQTEQYMRDFTSPNTSNTNLIAQSLFYIGKCFEDQNQFNKAIAILDSLYLKYPKNQYSKLALLKIVDLYEEKLNNNDKALNYLEMYLKSYPDTDNSDEVLSRINSLK